MKSVHRILATLFASIGLLATALAQEHGTREDAKALADAAVAHIKSAGADKSFEDFTKDKAAWTKKDIYVFVMDLDGNMKAHGANEKLVGKNNLGLRDKNGKEFVKDLVAMAAGKGDGWVDYEWVNPVSKKVEPKSSYVERVPGANLFVGVGIYR
jgi:signal transduction histidine kinase